MLFDFNEMEPQPIRSAILTSFLQEMFPSHLILLRGHVTWFPRSLDLSPYDLFLCVYLKAEMYEHCLQTVEKLKKTIREEIVRTPYGMLA